MSGMEDASSPGRKKTRKWLARSWERLEARTGRLHSSKRCTPAATRRMPDHIRRLGRTLESTLIQPRQRSWALSRSSGPDPEACATEIAPLRRRAPTTSFDHDDYEPGFSGCDPVANPDPIRRSSSRLAFQLADSNQAERATRLSTGAGHRATIRKKNLSVTRVLSPRRLRFIV